MAECSSSLRVDLERRHDVSILTVDGVLDSATYRLLRDAVINTALDEPRAVIVNVNDLSVPFASAWSAFSSAYWHVSTWPDVPILLACAQPHRRQSIARSGVVRHVPVYPTSESALHAAGELSAHIRRRARAVLPAAAPSARRSRGLITAWLTTWRKTELISGANTVATIFIENVLAHTDSAPVLIVENHQDTVTVAVEDGSHLPAERHEDADRGVEIVSGLAIVSAISRTWGSTPTSSGKTVWAMLGGEDQL